MPAWRVECGPSPWLVFFDWGSALSSGDIPCCSAQARALGPLFRWFSTQPAEEEWEWDLIIAPKPHRGPLKRDRSSLSSLLIRAASLLPEFPLKGTGQALGAPNPCAPISGACLSPQPYLSPAAIADSPAACLPLPPASLQVIVCASSPPSPPPPCTILLSLPLPSLPTLSPPPSLPLPPFPSSPSSPYPLLERKRSWGRGAVDSGHCTHSSKVSLQRSLGPLPSKEEEQLMIPHRERFPGGLFQSGARRGWE